MKGSFIVCIVAALLLSTTAWLMSLLLADALFSESAVYEDPDSIVFDIEDWLNSEPIDGDTITTIESKYRVFLRKGSLSDADVIDQEFKDSDVLVYELELVNEEELLAVFPTDSGGFFSSREWLQWFLHGLAAVCTVGICGLILNNRLKVLEGATQDARPESHETTKGKDPIQNAVLALNEAKRNIVSLSESQKNAAADHRDLLASVAHEFRNPLARLQFANEMAMDRYGSEQIELLQQANDAAVELDELVRETLRYSRISSLDHAMNVEHISVEDLFAEIAETIGSGSNDVALDIVFPNEELRINVDRRLFTRALTNLIDNGFRYANNSVKLSVTAEVNGCEFRVHDDGPGIPSIHHDKLFEPFYRVERSRSRETGGFGLGLSIVKSICNRHNASVSVHSEGRGTEFRIQLPSHPDNSGE